MNRNKTAETNGRTRRGTVLSLIAAGMITIGILLLMPANPCLGNSGAELLETAGISGGLVVHLGCGDGRLTAELAAAESFIVQGLDMDRSNVDQARATLRTAGGYGRVSAAPSTAARSPMRTGW